MDDPANAIVIASVGIRQQASTRESPARLPEGMLVIYSCGAKRLITLRCRVMSAVE
jgi:hypothetical protein